MKATAQESAARAEDLAWMARTGATPAEAAHRLGLTDDTLYKWCNRNDRLDLWRALQANSRAA